MSVWQNLGARSSSPCRFPKKKKTETLLLIIFSSSCLNIKQTDTDLLFIHSISICLSNFIFVIVSFAVHFHVQ